MTTNVSIIVAMLLMLWQTPGCQRLAVVKPGIAPDTTVYPTTPATQPSTKPAKLTPYTAPIIPKGFERYGVPEYPHSGWMWRNDMWLTCEGK